MNTIAFRKRKTASFLKGIVSAFDITGQTFIMLPDFASGFQRDREAIKGDWSAIGGDIRRSMYASSHEQ
jgi:hypothetical protein